MGELKISEAKPVGKTKDETSPGGAEYHKMMLFNPFRVGFIGFAYPWVLPTVIHI